MCRCKRKLGFYNWNMITLPIAEHTSPIDVLISFPEPWKNATKTLISFEPSTLSSLSKQVFLQFSRVLILAIPNGLQTLTHFFLFSLKSQMKWWRKQLYDRSASSSFLGTNAPIFNTQNQAVPFVPPAGDFLWHHTHAHGLALSFS